MEHTFYLIKIIFEFYLDNYLNLEKKNQETNVIMIAILF